jgi:diguanylate cyclase (GGDEF)-like protein/PAS domain S-box-containing protein
MFQVYDSVIEHHDLRLVVLAGVICFLCAYTSYSVVGRAVEAGKRARIWWIAAGAVATGSGIWATHFVAMLGYDAGMPMSFDLLGTALSLLVAIVISGIGFAISMMRRIGLPALGGAVIGAGIGAMHYIGMAALRLPAHMEYNRNFIVASLLLGIVLGGMASIIGLAKFDTRHRVTAALILTLAICALHFTGMSAMTLTADPTMAMGKTIEPAILAVAVTAVTMLILSFSLAGAILDEHLTSRSAQEAARLAASETRFRQLTDATFEGIVMYVGGKVVDANGAMAKLMGVPYEALVGRPVMSLVTDTSGPMLRKYIETQIDSACEIELKRDDGGLVPAEVLTRSFVGGDGASASGESDTKVLAVRDISERKEAEERIRHMAHHDALTGLPNRRMFVDRLHQVLARSKRDGTTVAVLCLDLDRFKHVNDLGGHAAGDELLRQVALRLNDSIRTEDTAARLGGDEFAVIQVGVAHPDGPGIMAERLVKAISKPFDLGAGQQTMIGTSVGIALYPGDGEEGEDLVRAADTALYRAKEAGRGTFRFFEAQMDVRLQERRLLERDLRQALAANQLKVHYQPLADCGGGEIVGFEALVRWTHAERGSISPAQFIPLAEECGLIMPLGAWVLRRACSDAATWPDDKLVAVNLSPAQFRHADLAKEILAVLRETGLPARRLELEVTESLLIDDPDRVLSTLMILKDAGVRISLDDFGTGYSSLSYLQRFPFDKIKIDRSFVSQMEKNADSMSIIRAVIALGKSLRIKITAEGVETAAQLGLLQAENCDLVQGYLLGKPMAKEDLGNLLAAASVSHEPAQPAPAV